MKRGPRELPCAVAGNQVLLQSTSGFSAAGEWQKGLAGFFLCFFVSSVLFAQSGEESESARTYFFHALKAKQEGRLLAAERLFRKAIEIEPQNPDFHFELGNLYAERSRFDGARKEYEQAIMISPDHLPARYNLGLVYRELGLHGEARDQFRKVLEINPHHLRAQLQIGYIYQQERFIEEARDAFRRAQEMNVTDPEPAAALEELVKYEAKLREAESAQMAHRFQGQNQKVFRLFSQDPASDPRASGYQLSSRQALVQAGAALIQELLARRPRSSSEDEELPS